MLRNRLVIAGLVLLLAAPAAFAAMTEQEVEQEHSLVTQLVTPHKKWAKGYVGGPVRALFIVKAAGYGAGSWYPVDTHLREVVELGQRFDLRPEAILVGNKGEPSDFLGEAMGYRRAERVRPATLRHQPVRPQSSCQLLLRPALRRAHQSPRPYCRRAN